MPPAELHRDLIRDRAKARGEPEWLVEARAQAFAAYEKLEAPRYRRTDLSGHNLPALALQALHAPAPERPRPVVDAPGALVVPLAEAAREHEDLVRPHLDRALDPTWTKWDALHRALWTSGWLVLIPKGADVAAPIDVGTRLAPEGGIVQDLVVLEGLSRATLMDRWTGGASTHAAVGMSGLEIHLREGAQLQLAVLQETERQTTLVSTRRARLGRDARLAWVDGQLGGGTVVMVNEALLDGPGSKIDFLGATFGGDAQHFDVTTSALHRAPHTESQLNMKGALTDSAYAVNYSIVYIGEDAAHSSGHQHQETLLLSEKARADAIPKLDVENNDVSASHGAAVGQVDPEQVFYLKARGLGELPAKRLIVEGFFEPLLREIPFEEVRDHIRGSLAARVR